MIKLSQLRRGRRLTSAKKRLSLRKKQPRYAGNKLQSQFRAAPKRRQTESAYLGSNIKLADLV